TGTFAGAAGIHVSDLSPVSTLTNMGTITVTAMASDGSASATGIDANGSQCCGNNRLEGILDNGGTVDVTATANTADASAFGIFVASTIAGAEPLTNSGHITVTATAPKHAFAAGIFSFERAGAACQDPSTHAPTRCGRLLTSLDNRGTITVTTHGASNS